ncbi:MAG TPA: hypothetical protein VGT41_01815 [Candidatus Babeliales bacterium]|nr:hypothetical protein [Candidatus Babeliales bacterium]
MNNKTIFFLILLLGSKNSFTTVVSATILKSPAANKKIILLEDIHYGIAENFLDPVQREQLGGFLKDMQHQTSLIIEQPIPNQRTLSFWYQKLYFYSWILRKLSYLSRNCPIISLREPRHLLSQLFVDSMDNQTTWKRIDTIATADQRISVDMSVCLMMQNFLYIFPETMSKKTYKEIVATKDYVPYNTNDVYFALVKKALFTHPIQLLLQGIHPRVTLQTYVQRLTELNAELDTLINSLAQCNLATDDFIATLKQEKETVIYNAYTSIEPYKKKINLTINQVMYKIFKKQKSFDNAFPIIQTLAQPAMLLSELGFLQKIVEAHASPKTETVILFAGIWHTLAVENYLQQLGYSITTQLPLIQVSKHEEGYEMNYWPWLTLLDYDDINTRLQDFIVKPT